MIEKELSISSPMMNGLKEAKVLGSGTDDRQ